MIGENKAFEPRNVGVTSSARGLEKMTKGLVSAEIANLVLTLACAPQVKAPAPPLTDTQQLTAGQISITPVSSDKPGYVPPELVSQKPPASPPEEGQKSPPPEGPINYTVQRGDTLYGIANAFGITVVDIQKANPSITNPNKIYAGQEIIIPVKGGVGGQDERVTSASSEGLGQTVAALPEKLGAPGKPETPGEGLWPFEDWRYEMDKSYASKIRILESWQGDGVIFKKVDFDHEGSAFPAWGDTPLNLSEFPRLWATLKSLYGDASRGKTVHVYLLNGGGDNKAEFTDEFLGRVAIIVPTVGRVKLLKDSTVHELSHFFTEGLYEKMIKLPFDSSRNPNENDQYLFWCESLTELGVFVATGNQYDNPQGRSEFWRDWYLKYPGSINWVISQVRSQEGFVSEEEVIDLFDGYAGKHGGGANEFSEAKTSHGL